MQQLICKDPIERLKQFQQKAKQKRDNFNKVQNVELDSVADNEPIAHTRRDYEDPKVVYMWDSATRHPKDVSNNI